MGNSKRDSQVCPNPTLENWIKFKEDYHSKRVKLPFFTKLKILNKMVMEQTESQNIK